MLSVLASFLGVQSYGYSRALSAGHSQPYNFVLEMLKHASRCL